MIETYNIEDIKDEITRWATVKTPTLYQHFAVYLGISTKEVKQIFIASQDIQDHIELHFQDERKQESIERNEKFEHDQAFLSTYISEAARKGKLVNVKKIAKEHGIFRCNIKAFAQANPELWEQATAIKSQQECARFNAERKAAIQAQHAENRRLKEVRKAEFEQLLQARKDEKAAKAAKAAYKILLIERKKQLAEIERNAREAKEATRLKNSNAQKFGSYVGSELRYEKGRLVKKLQFYISNIELAKIGFAGHVNFFFGDDNCCGIYVQKQADHIGIFPTRTNSDYQKFELTWNKRICDEPAEQTRAPLHLHLTTTPHNSGFYFRIPERFFLGYIPD